MTEPTNDSNNLYAELPDEMLQGMLTQFADNPKVTDMVQAILDGREVVARQQAVVDEFEASLGEFNLPEPPADVHNVMFRWAEVEIEDTTAEMVVVEIVDTPAVVVDGEITEPAITHEDMRYPVTKSMGWIKTPNYAQQVVSNGRTTTNSTGTRKLAITVSKITETNGVQGIELVGNFRTGKEACKFLGLDNGVSSANFHLQSKGYIHKPYEGQEFMVQA